MLSSSNDRSLTAPAGVLLVALCCLSLFSLTACGGIGGGGGGEEKVERIRFLHAAPHNKALRIIVDNEPADAESSTESDTTTRGTADTLRANIDQDDIDYREVSTYYDVLEGARKVKVFDSRNAVAVIDEEITIESGKSYTYVIYEDEEKALKSLLQADGSDTEPVADTFKVRFANLSPAAGSLDVYVVREGKKIGAATPAVTALESAKFSDYLEVPAGAYEVKFTETETKTVVENGGVLELTAGTTATVLLFDKKGGGEPYQTEQLSDD